MVLACLTVPRHSVSVPTSSVMVSEIVSPMLRLMKIPPSAVSCPPPPPPPPPSTYFNSFCSCIALLDYCFFFFLFYLHFLVVLDCGHDNFACPEKCLPKNSVCDGIYDCMDGSDEIGCSKLTKLEKNHPRSLSVSCLVLISV